MTNEKAIMCLEDMKIKVPIPKAAKQARENNEALDVAIKALQSTEPKNGKWIVKDDTERFIAQCNCCRYIEDSRRIKNFCPNCGAKMER